MINKVRKGYKSLQSPTNPHPQSTQELTPPPRNRNQPPFIFQVLALPLSSVPKATGFADLTPTPKVAPCAPVPTPKLAPEGPAPTPKVAPEGPALTPKAALNRAAFDSVGIGGASSTIKILEPDPRLRRLSSDMEREMGSAGAVLSVLSSLSCTRNSACVSSFALLRV